MNADAQVGLGHSLRSASGFDAIGGKHRRNRVRLHVRKPKSLL